ncbi:MAG: Rrf2 family transcriptional regulator [Rhodobacteraceae bacterium]|nr:Rrf2 family transcriptional regulator [Paracoccaceae bacterium]
MYLLSKKSSLALEAVLDVAFNARPKPVQSKDITERQGIQSRYLEQVLQFLVKRGILKGVRGPKGGYTLARERRRITLGDVLRVIEDLENEDDKMDSISELGEKVIQPIWAEFHDEMLQKLDKITLEDLCQKAEASGVGRAEGVGMDFVI